MAFTPTYVANMVDDGAEVIPIATEYPLPDSTEKYLVRSNGRDLFLAISSATAPSMVARAVRNQNDAAMLLGHPAIIELPIRSGEVGGRTFALWKRRTPLRLSRIGSRIDKAWVARGVLRWLRHVAGSSHYPSSGATHAERTERLSSLPALPARIRDASRRASKMFASGEIPARHVVEHGDLWPGNILLAPNNYRCCVIDWAGARLRGDPFCDLVNFALTSGLPRLFLKREARRHAKMLRCDVTYAPAYVLSGLGALHKTLEHFPEDRFAQKCVRTHDALLSL